jgi:signal transduction histidine kinase
LKGADDPILLNVDSEKLHACFINVVANAIQAMPEGGELNVEFKRDGDNEVITFSDTGAGIDPEVASHVFEPFFTTKREGIGLGLFFSRAIVERHGGTIKIGPNADGRGTTVTFVLPLGATGKRK